MVVAVLLDWSFVIGDILVSDYGEWWSLFECVSQSAGHWLLQGTLMVHFTTSVEVEFESLRNIYNIYHFQVSNDAGVTDLFIS